MKLSREELTNYRRDGFIGLNRQLFSPEKFASLQTDVHDLVNRNFAPDESNTLTTIHMTDPHFLKWATSPEVLDQVEQLIGPNIGLWAITLFLKRANSTKFVDWHCDSKVLQVYNCFETLDHVALLLAMSPNTRQQGCVRYIPGSHHDRSERHFNSTPYQGSLFGGTIYSLAEKEYSHETEKAITVELKMGEYSFHDIHSVHASDSNSSDQDRILLNFKYFPTHIRPVPDSLPKRGFDSAQTCYLVRGKDLNSGGFLKPVAGLV
jgi:non-haem Fe2+, alpha-ketoglutarate-dependent halogenase